MATLEDIFSEIKDKFPTAFRDNVPPGPPSLSDEINTPPAPRGISTRIGKNPAFRDEIRMREFQVGEAGDINERLAQEGVEAVAWYLPFHLDGTNWGVYVHWTRLKQLAAHIDRNTGVSPVVSVNAVYDALVAHELFHCRAEIFSTVGEELRQDSLYIPYLEHYRKVWGTPKCVEESLATSYGVAHVKDKVVRRELERISDNLPDGYKQWKNYPYSLTGFFHHGYWWKGIGELTDQITHDSDIGSWELTAHSVPGRILAGVPRYFWVEGNAISDDILTYVVQHKDFIECLRKVFPNSKAELINMKSGKHPFKLVVNGRKIPYKPDWDGVPQRIFNQVAQLLEITGSDLREKIQSCLL